MLGLKSCVYSNCPENQNILIIGQAFLPEGDKTSSQFIDFYTKHKNKIETLYEKLKNKS